MSRSWDDLRRSTLVITVIVIIIGIDHRDLMDWMFSRIFIDRLRPGCSGDRDRRWTYQWYAIQTTAGHENKVRSLIERKIVADPRPEEERLIRQALVPTQQVVEIKNGKKVTRRAEGSSRAMCWSRWC